MLICVSCYYYFTLVERLVGTFHACVKNLQLCREKVVAYLGNFNKLDNTSIVPPILQLTFDLEVTFDLEMNST